MEFTDRHQDSPPIPAFFTDRGALERVMEKERMREEVRKEMEMVRHAVEAEVRRELVMEQYALRGGLPLRSSQQLMDFAVSPQLMRRSHLGARAEETIFEGNMSLLLNRELQGESRGTEPVSCGGPQIKKLVILEGMPSEENKTATKRKAPSPPPQVAEDIDVPSVEVVNMNKTEENRLYCKVCRVSSNSEQSLQHHLVGRKHKYKVAVSSTKKEAAVENMGFRYWCRECKVGAHTEDDMLRHEAGKKHVNRLGRPESKFSVLVNDLAEWVDAYGKESITDELVDMTEPGEHKVVEEELEGV